MAARVFNKSRRCRNAYFLIAICALILMMKEYGASAKSLNANNDVIVDATDSISRKLGDADSGTAETPTADSESEKEESESDGDGNSTVEKPTTNKPTVPPRPTETKPPTAPPVKEEETETKEEKETASPIKSPVSTEVAAPVAEPDSTTDKTTSPPIETPKVEATDTQTGPAEEKDVPPPPGDDKSKQQSEKTSESASTCEALEEDGCEKMEGCKWHSKPKKCKPKDESSKEKKEEAKPTSTKPPTATPTKLPTGSPVVTGKSSATPTKNPVKKQSSADTEEDECGTATGCTSCKKFAPTVEKNSDLADTCQWKGEKCMTVKKESMESELVRCPEANTDNKEKPIDNATGSEDVNIGGPTSIPLQYAFGTLVILICFGITIRRCRTRKPSHHNNMSYGRVGHNNFYGSSFPPSNHMPVKYEGVYVNYFGLAMNSNYSSVFFHFAHTNIPHSM